MSTPTSNHSEKDELDVIYQFFTGYRKRAARTVISMDKYNLALFMANITFGNYKCQLNTVNKRINFNRFIIDCLEGRVL